MKWERVVALLTDDQREIASRIVESPHLQAQVPVAVTVAIPTADVAAANKIGYEKTDQLLLKEDFRPGALREALGRISRSAGIALSEPQERAVRASIHPEIVIRDERTSNGDGQLLFGPPEGADDALAVLDREQERLARHLGDGYRVVKGVAGSGKTLVLTFRARFLAESFPNQRFLLTCYNRVLADSLKAMLDSVENVEVATVDQMAYQVCRAAGIKIDGKGDERFRMQRAEALKEVQRRTDSHARVRRGAARRGAGPR